MNKLSQISVGCYAAPGSNEGYIYSAPMETQTAIKLVNDGLAYCQQGYGQFLSFNKKEGLVYIRYNDIKTILIKEADANYS